MRSKDESSPTIEIHRDELIRIRQDCHRLLTDFIQEIPGEIITYGHKITPDGKLERISNDSTTHKCQRNWFFKIISKAGTIKKLFPKNSDMWKMANNYEITIRNRTQIPALEDPHHFTDANGRLHRLTTEDEINTSDAFLRYVIEHLDQILS
jgi:hypothetical protein